MAGSDESSFFDPVIPNLLLIAAGIIVLIVAGMSVLGTIFFAGLLLIGNWVWRASVLLFLSFTALSSHGFAIIFGFFVVFGIAWLIFAFLARNAEPEDTEPRQTQAVERYQAQQLTKAAEITSFAQAVMRIQAQTTMSSRQKQQSLIAQYRNSRNRLQGAGELTPAVDVELKASLELALRSVGTQPAEIGQLLLELARSYEPTAQPRTERGLRGWVEKHGYRWE